MEDMNLVELDEVMDTDIVADNEDVYTDFEGRDENLGTKIGALVIGAGTTAVGVLVYKNRDRIKNKIREHQIRKLEKAGFTVLDPDVVVEEVEDEIDIFEEEVSK